MVLADNGSPWFLSGAPDPGWNDSDLGQLASAWVNVPVGRSVTLRVREYRGSSLVQAHTVAATGTGAWQQLSVAASPARGGTSVSVDVVASLTSTAKAQVDDVGLKRA